MAALYAVQGEDIETTATFTTQEVGNAFQANLISPKGFEDYLL
jgi:hypothetical protein